MKITQGNLEHIEKMASIRKSIVRKRVDIGCEPNAKALVAQTEDEVELFDAINCLNPDELSELVKIAITGGLVIDESLPISEIIHSLYLEYNLDVFLNKGMVGLNEI